MSTLETLSLVQGRKNCQGRRKLTQNNEPHCRVKKGTCTLSQGPWLPRDSHAQPTVAAPITVSYFGTIFATLHFWGSQPACLPE